MESKRKRLIIIVSIVLAIAIIIGIVFAIIANKNSNVIKIYDNVFIINEESLDNIPIEVTDNEIVFSTDQHYAKDDIIVAGILDTAPNGFIRKVVSTDIVDNRYVVLTTYACLTDVFEEAHFSKTFSISDEAVTPVDTAETSTNARIGVIQPPKSFANTLEIGTLISNEDSEADLISLEIKKNITDNISVNCSVGYRPYLLIDFDIENGEIEYSMAIKNTAQGKLSVELGSEKEFEKSIDIFSKKLPVIEFTIGTVPVVITNSIGATLDFSGGLRGSLGAEITLDYENTAGFKYSSSTNTVEEIKENRYSGDGIEWNTKASASAEIEAGVFFHLVSKLYDLTGVDLAAGITGSAEAEIMVSPNQKFNDLNYAGNIGLAITPKLKGDIVVAYPVIDYTLLSQPLFELELKSLWEKNWSSSGNWKQDILKANPVTIDEDSRLYEVYHAILKYVKNTYEAEDIIYFYMFDYEDDDNIYPIGTSVGVADFKLGYGEAGRATPVYYLRDLNYDGIPELFIGRKNGSNYDILAVYSYLEDIEFGFISGYCITSLVDSMEDQTVFHIYLTSNNEMLIRHEYDSGGKFITYNGINRNDRTEFESKYEKTIVNTNDFDWKDLSKFSSDL